MVSPQRESVPLASQAAVTRTATLLKIFLGEQTSYRSSPLYEAIVVKARELHLAGATVLRGPLGYGRSSRLHTQKISRLCADLPVVVEIIDTPEKIDAFLPILAEMVSSGLIVLENVRVARKSN